ncbi:MAG: DUF4111 domain-containing protein [Lachnospiraceae bacterium]|nr:DUF4111 domain-containing protein [Lachnospiraceae bacterium]
MPYQNILDELVDFTRQIFGEKLTGVYLHGSMAMGCFNPKKSDIDLIVIVENSISDTQKMQFMERIVSLNKQAPSKGLEVSIVKREYCNPFIYPTPFELHFSSAHLQWFHDDPQGYIENMKGVDIDLAAHFTMINHYGNVLFGEAVEKVFAEVPRKDYADSICADVENAKEEIIDNPVYIILNLCRVIAFLEDGLYLSKEEGGKWAMEHLQINDSALIADALVCYASDQDMNVQKSMAVSFAEEMGWKIKMAYAAGWD